MGVSSLLEDLFGFIGLGCFCKVVVSPDGKYVWSVFCVLTAVLMSDPVLLLASFDSLSCLSGSITIEVGVCYAMVSI